MDLCVHYILNLLCVLPLSFEALIIFRYGIPMLKSRSLYVAKLMNYKIIYLISVGNIRLSLCKIHMVLDILFAILSV